MSLEHMYNIIYYVHVQHTHTICTRLTVLYMCIYAVHISIHAVYTDIHNRGEDSHSQQKFLIVDGIHSLLLSRGLDMFVSEQRSLSPTQPVQSV